MAFLFNIYLFNLFIYHNEWKQANGLFIYLFNLFIYLFIITIVHMVHIK